MTIREYIPDALYVIRRDRGFKQISVAEQLGISKGLLSHYENGRTEPSISTLKSILDVYGVSISDFFGQWKE